MKNKTLGIIYLIVIFAAIVSVAYYWQVSNEPVVSNFPQHSSMTTNKEYKSDLYQFAFNYHTKYQLDTSRDQENYFQVGGDTVANVSIPQDDYPKTNFAQADITFAVKPKATAADCPVYVTSANATKQMTKKVDFPAGSFYFAEIEGAAAGTKYTTKIYRILNNNNTCYEANLTLGIANIENFEPETVSEVKDYEVWNSLSKVLESFRITHPPFNDPTDFQGMKNCPPGEFCE